jgi:hypothetical protein
LKGVKAFGDQSLQIGRCDPNWILTELCNKNLVSIPFVKFVNMSFLNFILSFLTKLEVEMNHCDGWTSKGSPLNYKDNTFLQRFLWNFPQKYIPSLFIVEIISGGEWPKVFAKVFLLVHLSDTYALVCT